VVIAAILTLPMAGWMRFRGMSWRPIVEMSVVPIALAIVLIAVVRARVAPGSTLQIELGSFCGISCVAMFVVIAPPRPAVYRADGRPHGSRRAGIARGLNPPNRWL